MLQGKLFSFDISFLRPSGCNGPGLVVDFRYDATLSLAIGSFDVDKDPGLRVKMTLLLLIVDTFGQNFTV